MSKININSIFVTQNSLRKPESINKWIEYLRHNKLKHPIVLNKTEDDKIWLLDGHHRLRALHLLYVKNIDEDEYHLTQLPYSYFNTINRPIFITPFDLNTEVRLCHFKPNLHLLTNNSDEFVLNNKHLYCEERKIWTVSELT